MILQFLLQIILLSLPTNAFTLKSNSTSSSKNDSNSFLDAIEPNPSAGNCFDADRYRISNKSFIKKINLEVFEFSAVRDRKSYYGVKYCQDKIPWALQSFKAPVGDEEAVHQECSYTIFEGDHREMTLNDYIDKIYNSYFHQKAGDRLQLPADRISHVIKRINFEVLLENFQGQEQKSYYGFDYNIFLSVLNLSNRHHWVFALPHGLDVHRDESEDIKFSYSLEALHFRGLFHLLLILAVTCLGNVILFVAWRWLGNITKKRKDIKMNEKFFERNGDLLLQQLLNSFGANVDRSFKLFKLTELNKATDHFNVKRVLGQGGQGTVYKGMLEDGKIIAVKKSNVVDEGKIEEFINEVVLLAQINHRNVVKLLGCCLEAEVPLLVYEFISNGTLFQYLHDQNEEFPLKWDTRLRIATEVSSALSYMHSGASFSIFHRDIKSTNILLDNNYTAKVADFGASRSISIDKTHLSTIILGTCGYLDPEYFQTSRLTDKSDVYSFGVVLVELLTGQKPIFLESSQENISLAAYFIRCMKEKRLNDILDAQVKQHGKMDEIMVFANLAKRCLNQNGKERPTMKEIVIELERIPLSKKKKVSFREVIKRFSKGD